MRGILTEDMIYGLGPGSVKVCRGLKTGLIEYDEENNHVHLLLKYPPKIDLFKPTDNPKDVFDRLLQKDLPECGTSLNKLQRDVPGQEVTSQ